MVNRVGHDEKDNSYWINLTVILTKLKGNGLLLINMEQSFMLPDSPVAKFAIITI